MHGIRAFHTHKECSLTKDLQYFLSISHDPTAYSTEIFNKDTIFQLPLLLSDLQRDVLDGKQQRAAC